MEDTVNAFRTIYMKSECIFAKSAVLLGPPLICPENTSVEDYIEQHAQLFFEFCDRLEIEYLDGFLFAFSEKELGISVSSVSSLLRRVVLVLAERDQDAAISWDNVNSVSPDWRFKCRSRDFFISIFARCYNETSSRHGFGSQYTFLHFQPSETFTRHRPPNQDRIPEAVRELIRKKYAAAGRAYDTSLHADSSQALRFVGPCDVAAGSVVWWED